MSCTCGESAGSEQETYWSLQDDSEVELDQVHVVDAKTASSGVQSGCCGSPQCSSSSGGVQDAKESKNQAGERSQALASQSAEIRADKQDRRRESRAQDGTLTWASVPGKCVTGRLLPGITVLGILWVKLPQNGLDFAA